MSSLAEQGSLNRRHLFVRGTVAVVIPAYNYAQYVAEAIQSAIEQGESVNEIVVVDDGSTDNTVEAVQAMTDPRLNLIKQSNQGLPAALNVGWQASRSEWVQVLGADDKLAPDSVKHLVAAARQDPTRIPFGIQGVFGPVIQGEPLAIGRLADRGGNLYDDICLRYYGNLTTVLVPRTAFEQLGGFNQQVRLGEDYDFGIRLARKYEFTHVPRLVYCSRMHGTNMHRKGVDTGLIQYLDTVRRNLANEPGLAARWRYHKAMAQWLWYFGQKALEANDLGAARARFRAALCHHPAKLGAWRGWWFCVRSSARGPRTPAD